MKTASWIARGVIFVGAAALAACSSNGNNSTGKGGTTGTAGSGGSAGAGGTGGSAGGRHRRLRRARGHRRFGCMHARDADRRDAGPHSGPHERGRHEAPSGHRRHVSREPADADVHPGDLGGPAHPGKPARLSRRHALPGVQRNCRYRREPSLCARLPPLARGGKVSDVTSLVADAGDFHFDATVFFNGTTTEDWSVVPEAQRPTRDAVIAAGNAYYDYFSTIEPSWFPVASTCTRLEGTNNDQCLEALPRRCRVQVTERMPLFDEIARDGRVHRSFSRSAGFAHLPHDGAEVPTCMPPPRSHLRASGLRCGDRRWCGRRWG